VKRSRRKVINAAMHGPQWAKTVVIYSTTSTAATTTTCHRRRRSEPTHPPGVDREGSAGAYDRYGIRVPGIIVSPFAKRDYVSHVVHDQTSILKFIETKWNLGAMTYRDANADEPARLTRLPAPPAFLEPPTLPAAGAEGTCKPGIPEDRFRPPTAVVPASEASSLRVGATA
jgi:phospholipase C